MTVSISHPYGVDTGTTQPTSMLPLLRELGVDHSSVEKQIPLLRDWLAHHPPNPMLRVSLRCNGYGLLLKEDSVARYSANSGTE